MPKRAAMNADFNIGRWALLRIEEKFPLIFEIFKLTQSTAHDCVVCGSCMSRFYN